MYGQTLLSVLLISGKIEIGDGRDVAFTTPYDHARLCMRGLKWSVSPQIRRSGPRHPYLNFMRQELSRIQQTFVSTRRDHDLLHRQIRPPIGWSFNRSAVLVWCRGTQICPRPHPQRIRDTEISGAVSRAAFVDHIKVNPRRDQKQAAERGDVWKRGDAWVWMFDVKYDIQGQSSTSRITAQYHSGGVFAGALD